MSVPTQEDYDRLAPIMEAASRKARAEDPDAGFWCGWVPDPVTGTPGIWSESDKSVPHSESAKRAAFFRNQLEAMRWKQSFASSVTP